MSGYVVVDASVWVSRLAPADSFHARGRAWMDEQRANDVTLLAPALLLAEVGGAISRRTGDHPLSLRCVEMLKSLPGLRLVEMDQSLVNGAARLAASLGLRGADSLYVALAEQLKLPLATLDQDQGTRAKGVVALVNIDQAASL